MPLPTPSKDEEESAFISRFMGDTESVKNFSDEKQRAAVAYQKWRHHQTSGAKQEMSMAFPAQTGLSVGAPEGMPLVRKLNVGGIEKDIPLAYLDKDVIAVGNYINPANGQTTYVTPERIDNWVQQTNAMLADGVEIPVVLDHKENADAARGQIVKSYRKGDRLHMVAQIQGEDWAKQAMVNKVSPKIHSNFFGGNGKHYGDTITHLGLTPTPVVPGQGNFVTLSASRGAETEAPVYFFAAPTRSPAMPLSQEQQTKIRELGAGEEITETNVVDFLLTKVNLTASSNTQTLSRATTAETERDELKRKLTAKESEVQELSRKQTQETVSPLSLSLMVRAIRTEKEKAISSGGLCPAIADELELALCGPKETPNVTLLSRTAPGSADPYAMHIFTLLSRNTPTPKGGTVTATQIIPKQEERTPMSDARRAELMAY